jgi:protein-arginine kinase activator protein McsA
VGRTLKEQLEDAIANEKYELAAEIRDELNRRDSRIR